MTTPASEPADHETALAALNILREELGKMKVADASRRDGVTLLHTFERYLHLTDHSIRLHAEVVRRMEQEQS